MSDRLLADLLYLASLKNTWRERFVVDIEFDYRPLITFGISDSDLEEVLDSLSRTDLANVAVSVFSAWDTAVKQAERYVR